MDKRANLLLWPVLSAILWGAITFSSAQAADPLKASRTELAVGETVSLEIPDAMGLIKPKWTLSPPGIVEFGDKGRTGAVVRGLAPGKVTVSARVKGLLGGDTTHAVSLTVTAAASSQAKPAQDRKDTSGGSKSLDDAKMRQIGGLLQRYEAQLADIRALFGKDANKNATPALDKLSEHKLELITEAFFKDLGGMGLSLWHLQQFKERYKAASGGGSPLFPGQGAWDDTYLATERALMMGRARLVQRLWMETLQDTFRANPDAAVFGEIDIGSWVKMRLGDLGFQADIDFSSVSIDPDLNRWIVRQFESKLRQHTSLDMVQADALLTAHGQATPDVFIGDWGKTFAELDMLKRSKWKVIHVEKDANGNLVLDENGQPKIRMVERAGSQLFWEVAFRKLQAGQAAEVEFPRMDLAKEPMLSLEMLRHGIHDIEHGPYERGQKLIKMLKYAERSYFMSKKAVAEFGFNPYAENNPRLARAAEVIIANKNNPAVVADALAALAGEEITTANVDTVTNRLVADAKTAMMDNAARALAFRLNAIARIDSDDARQKAAEKLWQDLGTELDTFRDTAGEPPRVMVQAQEMAKAVMEGKLPAADLEARANDLHKLLNEAYKLPDSVIDRILLSDSYLKVKAALRKLGWVEKSIDEFVRKARQKFPNGADFYDKFQDFNEQLNKTTAGSGLLKTADFADNAFTVYEAYLGSNADDALWNASLALGRVGLQESFPSLQIPLALYDSARTGSPKPVAMAVVFMYFPFAGQTYMVSQMMGRADVAIRDAEFYTALNKMLDVTEFDSRGRITGFSLKNILGKEIDSETISPPGNRKAIVALFTRPDSTFYVSPNFRYWSSLVPRQDDRFGRYENKLQNLRRFFGLSEDVAYMTHMLEHFRAQSGKMPQDRYTAQRQAALAQMEDQLTETLWVAMADMLESAAKSVQSPELDAKVRKVEEELNLGDDDLGKNKGILAKIKWEIRQNSSLFSGENPYAVGLIYDKYLKAYERVSTLRRQIVLDIWNGGLGIDYVAAQSKPMKLLLMGGKSGAPALTGDPAADVDLAEKALAAHRAAAGTVRADLAAALGRDVDDAGDKDHLKALGQLWLEREHLLDDCPGRAAPNCDATTRTALQDRVRQYKDYLAKLGAALQPVQMAIDGPTELKLGEHAEFEARFAKAEDVSRPGLALRWSVDGQARGNGGKFSLRAEKAGTLNLSLTAWVGVDREARKLGEASQTVTVKDGKDDKKSGADDAAITSRIDAALKARDWQRLADLLDATRGDKELRYKQTERWDVRMKAINGALETLKGERMKWLLAWEGYIRELERVDSRAYDSLKKAVEKQVTEFQNRCFESGSDPAHLRGERCQKEAYAYEEKCLPKAQRDAHWDEQKRIRDARNLLPDEVHLMHSAGFPTYRAWFEKVESLAKTHGLPFPYPEPVVARLKYASQCARLEDTKSTKKLEDLTSLKVSLKGPTAPVPLGKPVTLTAAASGGKGPYSHAWSGAAGSGARATLTPAWAGDWTVSVAVRDADGQGGEASVTVMVSPMKVKLAGAKGQVFYGSSAGLSTAGLGLEIPAPAPDPCAGKPRSNNPFDECNKIAVTAPPTSPCRGDDPFCVDTSHAGVRRFGDLPPPQDGMTYDPNLVQALPESGPAPTSQAPGPGAYQIVWQSEPGLTFDPPKSSDGKTKVTYDRMGQVKLWCELLQFKEGDFHTVGECDQVTVTVVAPKFSVSFSPADGQARVGQEVRARISAQPSVPARLIDYRWLDPATSNRMEYGDNAGEIGFKVKDASTLVLKALARVPYHGDEIATVDATYTGAAYEVKAWVVEPGTRPMMWDAKKGGLVPVPKGSYAIFERIGLKAEIQGGPSDGVRWNWTVNDGTSLSNPISQTPTVSRGEAGGITARVTARDKDGAVLGSADVSLSVMAVSDKPPVADTPTVVLQPENASPERGASTWINAQASGGKPPYRYVWSGAQGSGARARATPGGIGGHPVSVTVRDSGGRTATASVTLDVQPNRADRDKSEATRLGEQAREQLRRGDLPAAIQSAREAQKLDKAAARQTATEVSQAAKKAGWQGVYDRDFSQVVANLEAAVALNPGDKDAQDKLARARGYAQVWPRVEAKAREFDAQIAARKYFSAQQSLQAMQALQANMPGTSEKALPSRVQKDFDAGMAEYNAFMRQVEETHRRAFQEKDWQTMLRNAESALEREHGPANEKMLKDNVELARKMLREEAQTAATLANTRAAPAQGAPIARTWPAPGSPATAPSGSAPPVIDLPAGLALATDKAGYAPGDTVTLRWGGIAQPAAQDWIGLYAEGAANEKYGEWYYLKGQAGGILKFKAPQQAGTYEFRLFLNWPAGGYKDVARSPRIRVGAGPLPASATPEASAAPPAWLAGKWQTSEGMLTLNQSGARVTGTYTNDGGEIEGEVKGNVLEGWWIENSSGQNCGVARNGRKHWGRIRWIFDDGRFVGGWSYCDAGVDPKATNWKGERIGAAPPAPVQSAPPPAQNGEEKSLDKSVDDLKKSLKDLKGLFNW